MAVGDKEDILNRLLSQIPEKWFGTDHPLVNQTLSAYVNTAYFNYNDQYLYTKLQTRIKTATDVFLDMISKDFLGNLLPRRSDENDESFRNRILATILQLKATRRAMYNALYLLTGYPPTIFEPWRDGSYYNVNAFYGKSKYGSFNFAYQCFIDVYAGEYQGLVGYGGYDTDVMTYNTVNPNQKNYYANESLGKVIVTDFDIYQLINLTKCEGTVCWTRIHRTAPPPVPTMPILKTKSPLFWYGDDNTIWTDGNNNQWTTN
jgi:hypothetical protein